MKLLSTEVARLREEASPSIAIQKGTENFSFTIFCMKVEAWKEGEWYVVGVSITFIQLEWVHANLLCCRGHRFRRAMGS